MPWQWAVLRFVALWRRGWATLNTNSLTKVIVKENKRTQFFLKQVDIISIRR